MSMGRRLIASTFFFLFSYFYLSNSTQNDYIIQKKIHTNILFTSKLINKHKTCDIINRLHSHILLQVLKVSNEIFAVVYG